MSLLRRLLKVEDTPVSTAPTVPDDERTINHALRVGYYCAALASDVDRVRPVFRDALVKAGLTEHEADAAILEGEGLIQDTEAEVLTYLEHSTDGNPLHQRHTYVAPVAPESPLMPAMDWPGEPPLPSGPTGPDNPCPSSVTS